MGIAGTHPPFILNLNKDALHNPAVHSSKDRGLLELGETGFGTGDGEQLCAVLTI